MNKEKIILEATQHENNSLKHMFVEFQALIYKLKKQIEKLTVREFRLRQEIEILENEIYALKNSNRSQKKKARGLL